MSTTQKECHSIEERNVNYEPIICARQIFHTAQRSLFNNKPKSRDAKSYTTIAINRKQNFLNKATEKFSKTICKTYSKNTKRTGSNMTLNINNVKDDLVMELKKMVKSDISLAPEDDESTNKRYNYYDNLQKSEKNTRKYIKSAYFSMINRNTKRTHHRPSSCLKIRYKRPIRNLKSHAKQLLSAYKFNVS